MNLTHFEKVSHGFKNVNIILATEYSAHLGVAIYNPGGNTLDILFFNIRENHHYTPDLKYKLLLLINLTWRLMFFFVKQADLCL